MTLLEKIDFIQKRSGFSDKKFCKVFRFPLPSLWQLRKGLYKPEKPELSFLCKKFNLDLDDFLDDASTISVLHLKLGEHVCKLANTQEDSEIYEDYPIESNDRYEEKD